MSNSSSQDRTGSLPGPHTWLLPVGLGALFLLKLGTAVWGLDRGYELGDEGFFLLNLNQPASSPRFFEFYKLLLLWDEPPRFDVLAARWLRLGAELSGSLALVAGVWSWARREFFASGAPHPLAFFAYCGMGVLLSAASRSFSYNDLTTLCTYCAMGALFYGASLDPGSRARAALFAAGFLSGFQVFVKFPSALGLGALVGLALVCGLGRWRGRERVVVAALYALGALAALGVFVASNRGVAPLVAKFRGASEVGAMAGYDPIAMVERYLLLEVWTAVNLVVIVLAFGVSYALLRRVGRTGIDRAFAGAVLVAAAVMSATVRPLHSSFASAPLTALSVLLVFVPLVLGTAWLRTPGASRAPRSAGSLAALAVLLALPLANYAGTNVPLVSRLPSHALPLFVALALCSFDLRARTERNTSHAVVGLVLALVTSLVFVRHHVLEPYGVRSPLYEQVHSDPGLPGVRVDLATHRFLSEVAASLADAGFVPGDPVVAMDYMPGLVFYLGGRSPGFPFYAFGRTELNCFNLNRAGLGAPPFLILGRPLSDAQRACIEAFDFPEDFRLVRTLRFPYERVYAAFGGHGLSHVSLYAPRPDGG